MLVTELIEMLKTISDTHPEAQVVEARTLRGVKSHTIAVRIKGHILLIEGDKNGT